MTWETMTPDELVAVDRATRQANERRFASRS